MNVMNAKKKTVKKAVPAIKLINGRYSNVLTLRLEPREGEAVEKCQTYMNCKQKSDAVIRAATAYPGLQEEIRRLKNQLETEKERARKINRVLSQFSSAWSEINSYCQGKPEEPDDDDDSWN